MLTQMKQTPRFLIRDRAGLNDTTTVQEAF